MGEEKKHGEYEKFDLNKARWVCPECEEDAMMVETRAFRSPYKFTVSHSFRCEKCGLSTLDYGFSLRNKDSFNASHKRFTQMWEYLMIAKNKGWVDGFSAGAKMAAQSSDSDD